MCLMCSPLIQFLFLFQGTMEYVFELDVSGKVEDVVETLLQVSQRSSQILTGKLFWKEFHIRTSRRNHNPFYESEWDLLECVELKLYIRNKS